MQEDDNQIEVPPSFIAVHSDARHRLQGTQDAVRARYELCEDLASHLAGQAAALHHDTPDAQRAILARFAAGLADAASGLAAGEARWTVQRMAELLEWAPLPAVDPGVAEGEGRRASG